MTSYTASQLREVPMAVPATVTLVTGEEVTGLFDGAFVIDATDEVTGCQIVDKPPLGVRFIEAAEIAKVVVP